MRSDHGFKDDKRRAAVLRKGSLRLYVMNKQEEATAPGPHLATAAPFTLAPKAMKRSAAGRRAGLRCRLGPAPGAARFLSPPVSWS